MYVRELSLHLRPGSKGRKGRWAPRVSIFSPNTCSYPSNYGMHGPVAKRGFRSSEGCPSSGDQALMPGGTGLDRAGTCWIYDEQASVDESIVAWMNGWDRMGGAEPDHTALAARASSHRFAKWKHFSDDVPGTLHGLTGVPLNLQ